MRKEKTKNISEFRNFIQLVVFLAFPGFAFSQELKIIPATIDASFRGLSVIDDKTAWLSGSKGNFGISTDGGNTWKFNRIKGFEKFDFRTVYAFDEKHALVANAGSPAYILFTEDAGINWKIVYENKDSAAFFDGIAFWNGKEGIVYGDPVDHKMLILRTSDGGLSWTQTETMPVLENGEASFAASGTTIRVMGDRKVIIATGGKVSRLWVSEDKGAHWKTISTPIIQGENSRGIFSFVFKNDNEGIIVGGDYTKDSLANKNIFYTKNSGTDWVAPTHPTRGYRECVEYITDEIVLACGPSGIDISKDGGKNWNPFSDEKLFHVLRKARKGNLVIVAGGKGKTGVIR